MRAESTKERLQIEHSTSSNIAIGSNARHPNTLDRLLNPSSIAIIGASEDPHRVGGMPIRLLAASGFSGHVYLVNPNHAEIGGVKCYADIASVPEVVDLALVALPATLATEAVADCAAVGTGAAVVFSSGFAESGRAGATLQRKLQSSAKASGMRLLGPNCAGFINFRSRVPATFGSHLSDNPELVIGNVGFVTQSGAVGAYLYALARQRRIGFSYWVSTGNEADTQVADHIEYLSDDPNTRVIGIYLEQVRDGDRLMRAVDKANSRAKPVICLKVGTSDIGRRAAMSHTAAVSGNRDLYAAALKELGVIEVRSLDDFLDAMTVLSNPRYPAGKRVGILSISGGLGIMLADHCVEAGLQVPPLSKKDREEIESLVTGSVGRNPVDITGNIASRPETYAAALAVMLSSSRLDSVVSFLGHTTLASHTGRRFAAETTRAAIFLTGNQFGL